MARMEALRRGLPHHHLKKAHRRFTITKHMRLHKNSITSPKTSIFNAFIAPQQDRLYHLLYDLGCFVCSNSLHWIQTYSNGIKSSFYQGNVLDNLQPTQSDFVHHHFYMYIVARSSRPSSYIPAAFLPFVNVFHSLG